MDWSETYGGITKKVTIKRWAQGKLEIICLWIWCFNVVPREKTSFLWFWNIKLKSVRDSITLFSFLQYNKYNMIKIYRYFFRENLPFLQLCFKGERLVVERKLQLYDTQAIRSVLRCRFRRNRKNVWDTQKGYYRVWTIVEFDKCVSSVIVSDTSKSFYAKEDYDIIF